jgi:hypothetical protein
LRQLCELDRFGQLFDTTYGTTHFSDDAGDVRTLRSSDRKCYVPRATRRFNAEIDFFEALVLKYEADDQEGEVRLMATGHPHDGAHLDIVARIEILLTFQRT